MDRKTKEKRFFASLSDYEEQLYTENLTVGQQSAVLRKLREHSEQEAKEYLGLLASNQRYKNAMDDIRRAVANL